jgi:small GTP-binding protein
MRKKKVCLLGAYGVGKTSLVRRFVESIFEERYQTTVGVRIERKDITVHGIGVQMILWDLAGEDDLSRVRPAYLQGAAGCIFVADGTRPETLEIAERLRGAFAGRDRDMPFVLALNKSDLQDSWAITAATTSRLGEQGWEIRQTSAKTGEGVEDLFQALGERILHGA